MAQARTFSYAQTTTPRRSPKLEPPAARKICSHPNAHLVSMPNSQGEELVPAMICVACGETLIAWGHFLG